MEKKNIKYIIIAIFSIVTILVFLYYFIPFQKINSDIKIFNQINQWNLNLNQCNKISNQEIKAKCVDNYYSLLAFEKNDEKICENIISNELKNLCKQEILKFNNN